MTEDLSPDPPPLPPLPPDPVSPGPDVGVRGSSSVSPSSSPMDLFPEVSVSDSTVPIKNPSRLPQASSGRSLPLQGSFIFGSLSPNAPILPVPSVDSTNENPDSSIPAVYPSEIPIQVSHPAGSVSDGAPNIAGQAPNNHSPSSAAFNWASNLSSLLSSLLRRFGFYTSSRKSKNKSSEKKRWVSEAKINVDGSSTSKLVFVEKIKVSQVPPQPDSANKFHPLQGEEPKEVSNSGSFRPKIRDGPEVVGPSAVGVPSSDKTLALSFSPGTVSVMGSSLPQSHRQPPSSALVVSNGKGLNSSVAFSSSPKSSAERKKKKRKYSSPVHQGTSGILPIGWKKDHTPSE
ncbi:hypothetical protein Bca4012_056483 [Brassica carinata]